MSNKGTHVVAAGLLAASVGMHDANANNNIHQNQITPPATSKVTDSVGKQVAALGSDFFRTRNSDGSNVSFGAVNHGRETGIAGAMTLPNGDFAVRIAGDISKNEAHFLAAAGYSFDAGYIIIGGSHATEQAWEFDSTEDLTGKSAFFRINLSDLTPAVRSAFLEVVGKKSDSVTLDKTATSSISVTREELADIIREITIRETTRTTRRFIGGQEITARLGMEFNIGQNGILELNVSEQSGDFWKDTSGGVKYTHYFPTERARFSIEWDTGGEIRTGVFKGFGKKNNWEIGATAFTNTEYSNSTGALAVLRYNFGGSNGSYTRPENTRERMIDTINTFDTTSRFAMNNIHRYGEIKTEIETTRTIVNEVIENKTHSEAPTLVVQGNTITVTSHGITDKDWPVHNVEYSLYQNGKEITRNNTGIFSNLAAGNYEVETSGMVINGITKKEERYINPNKAPQVIEQQVEKIETTLQFDNEALKNALTIGNSFQLSDYIKTNSPAWLIASVSNTNVATFDKATGTVTVIGAGKISFTVRQEFLSKEGKEYSEHSEISSASFEVAPVNETLTIGNITCDATTVIDGDTVTCNITPEDPQGVGNVTASVNETNVAVTTNGNAYTAVLTGLAVGTHTLEWKVQGKNPDGSLEPVQTARQTVTVNKKEIPNSAPEFIDKTPVSVPVIAGMSGSVDLPRATDKENNPITYRSLQTLPNGFSIDTNGRLTWNANTQKGKYEIKIVANDGKLDSESVTVKISVTDPNFAPVLPNGDVTVPVVAGTAGNMQLPTATDKNGDTLTYIVVGTLPQGFSLNQETGLLSWGTNITSDASFKIKVNDGELDSNEVNVIISVTIPNSAPTLPATHSANGITGTAGSTMIPAGTDAENDTLTYTIEGTIPAEFSLSDHTLSWASNTAPGNYTISIKANDGKLDSNIMTVSVNIEHLPNLSGPNVEQPTATSRGGFVIDATTYMCQTDLGDVTLGNLMANDPDGIGSYTITSSIFWVLASGTSTLPSNVVISGDLIRGRFGQHDVVTVSVTDNHPINPQTTTKTITIQMY